MADNFRQKRTPRQPYHIAVLTNGTWEQFPLSVRKNRALHAWRRLRVSKYQGLETKFLQPNESA